MCLPPKSSRETPSKEVLIEGYLYNVDDFKHPGGSIIKFLTNGGDATEAFKEFHTRSRKADLVLKSLPKRPYAGDIFSKDRSSNGNEALAKDFAALRKELEDDGFFKSSPAEVTYRLSEIVVMHIVGLYLFLSATPASFLSTLEPLSGLDTSIISYVVKALGILTLGLVSGRCGWLMHEGGHYSLTGKIGIDRIIQIVLYGVGCGMSAGWWRSQHNKHHATPQKLQHDVDLDTLPLVAFCSEVAAKARGPFLKIWLSLQGFLFIPVSCLLVALGWQYFLHPRYIVRTNKVTTEGVCLLFRNIAIFGFILAGYSWTEKIALYCTYNHIAASYIFTNFALSHTHLPVTLKDDYLPWVIYAASHTTNLNPNFLTNWWMAYLNFQIEHHLFPSMPQFRHPQTSKRVQKLFAKHGLKYDTRPYFSCLWDTLMNLHQVGNGSEEHAKSA